MKIERAADKTMDEWLDAVQAELALSLEINKDVILDAARDAAHAVERPAAPITTFLLGYAVAQGGDLALLSEKISQLAQKWPKK